MRYYSSVYAISHEFYNQMLNVETAAPMQVPENLMVGHASEIEALIAAHQQIVRHYQHVLEVYGPGPYFAIYAAGMIHPVSADFDKSDAELYAGPFERWTAVQEFVHSNGSLANNAWKWGDAPLAYLQREEVDEIIAVLGPPPQQPVFA